MTEQQRNKDIQNETKRNGKMKEMNETKDVTFRNNIDTI
jgi:hypothetical protein